MSAGIEIYNTNGHIQITESFKNLQFLGKASFTISTKYITAPYTVILPSNVKFIAFSCSNSGSLYGTLLQIYLNGDGTSTAQFGGKNGLTITYYMFGYPITNSGNSFEVYNAVNELVFSDNAKYMKVVGMVNGLCSTSNYGNVLNTPYIVNSFAYSGITPAILLGCYSLYEQHDDNGSGYLFMDQFFRFTTSSIISELAVKAINGYCNGGLYTFKPNYNYLIIDVTGL